MPVSLSLRAIAAHIDATLEGDGDLCVTRLVHPSAYENAADLALAMDDKLLPLLAAQNAAAAVVSKKAPADPRPAPHILRVARPRLALSRLTNLFAAPPEYGQGRHPTAIIDPTAEIGAGAIIGPYCVIGPRARIGANVTLQSHVTVEADAAIGADSTLRSGVRLGAGCILGARNLLHFNCSLGSDGFSFVTPEPGSVETAKAGGAITATNSQGLLRIASLGAVITGDDVEIGASTSIDRGTIISTRIGRGTKIDNQVQIGHNVQIGEDCLLCGRVGIAGSVVIGNRVVIGGGGGVADHVTVGDDAMIMASSGVGSNVPPREIYGGTPAMPRQKALENLLALNRLKSLSKQVEDLAAAFKKLEPDNKTR